MTINDFTSSLIKAAEEELKGISFIDTSGKKADIKGYLWELPVKTVCAGWEGEEEQAEGPEELFPYFLVQVDEISYEDEAAEAKIWILLAVYDGRQNMAGWINISNAVERLVFRFRRDPVLLDYYYCSRVMKVSFPEKSSWPYFFAGIEMTWNLPAAEVQEQL